MNVTRIFTIVLRPCDEGWSATCRKNLPDLAIYGATKEEAKDKAIAAIKEKFPTRAGQEDVFKSYAHYHRKPAPYVYRPITEANIDNLINPRGNLLAKALGRLNGRLRVRDERGQKLYVLDGKRYVTIPQIITAAGYDA